MKPSNRQPRGYVVKARRGSACLYAAIVFFVLCGFISLATDLARARLARAELQTVADAAARAAAGSLSDLGTARELAKEAATRNRANAAGVTLQNSDIQFGNWDPDSKVFTTAASGADAVRVTPRLSSARGTPVTLTIGSFLGISSVDVSASAIAQRTSSESSGGALIGLNSVEIQGNGGVDSYKSADGTYNATKTNESYVASNGDITIKGNAKVFGDARPGINKQVKMQGNGYVTGNTSSLTTPMAYDPPVLGSYNNSPISSRLDGQKNLKLNGNGSYTIPPGSYYVKDFTINGNIDVSIGGDVTLYVSGNATINGNSLVSGTAPASFKIHMLTPGKTLTVNGNAGLSAVVYAPLGDVSISGNHHFYGTVIAKNLSVTGNAGLHHDRSAGSETTQGKIYLVR